MTVKKLIELLQSVEDQQRVVVMAADSEGNSFNLLETIDENSRYKDEEIGIDILTPALIKKGYSQEDVMRGGKKAIVLW